MCSFISFTNIHMKCYYVWMFQFPFNVLWFTIYKSTALLSYLIAGFHGNNAITSKKIKTSTLFLLVWLIYSSLDYVVYSWPFFWAFYVSCSNAIGCLISKSLLQLFTYIDMTFPYWCLSLLLSIMLLMINLPHLRCWVMFPSLITSLQLK